MNQDSFQSVAKESLKFTETVEYVCWSCDKLKTFNRFERIPDPLCLRCQECAERDGVISTDKWQWILAHENKSLAYKNVLSGCSTGNIATDPSRLQIPAIFKTAQANPEVAEWVDSERHQPLILLGQTGTGKTYQACAALLEIAHRTKYGKCKLVNCASLGRIIQNESLDILMAYALVLDDFGAKLTPAAIATAYEIIDHRIAHQKATIITSNLDLGRISDIDERIASRLSLGHIITINGIDRRLRVEA